RRIAGVALAGALNHAVDRRRLTAVGAGDVQGLGEHAPAVALVAVPGRLPGPQGGRVHAGRDLGLRADARRARALAAVAAVPGRAGVVVAAADAVVGLVDAGAVDALTLAEEAGVGRQLTGDPLA